MFYDLKNQILTVTGWAMAHLALPAPVAVTKPWLGGGEQVII
jgi:hypothetical protein